LRLAATLARLAGAADGGTEVIELPVSQTELAELAGLSRNTVGRILPRLQDAGCVETRYRRLVVDPARLRTLLERAC